MSRHALAALSSVVISCGAGGVGPGADAPAPSARDQALAACLQDCNLVAATCPTQMGDACNQATNACVSSCEQMAAALPDVPVDAGQAPPAEQTGEQPNELARVVQVLTANGYSCTQEELRYLCTVPDDGWPVAVAWLVETDKISIWYDSYQLRAFARPCAEFDNAMKDLASTEHGYLVSCDDQPQSFRMNTAVLYTPDMDVMGWMQSHLQRRAESLRLLSSISAIRQ